MSIAATNMKKTLAPLVRREGYRVVLLRRGLHDTAAVTGEARRTCTSCCTHPCSPPTPQRPKTPLLHVMPCKRRLAGFVRHPPACIGWCFLLNAPVVVQGGKKRPVNRLHLPLEEKLGMPRQPAPLLHRAPDIKLLFSSSGVVGG